MKVCEFHLGNDTVLVACTIEELQADLAIPQDWLEVHDIFGQLHLLAVKHISHVVERETV